MISVSEGLTPSVESFALSNSPLPAEASDFLASDTKRLEKVELSPVFSKTFEDGSQSFLTRAKGIHNGGEGRIDMLDSLYVFDIFEDELAGYGIATLHADTEDPDMANRPFVDFTKTFPKYGGNNLGHRRLITLNEATQQFFKLPLYASRVISDRAEEIWIALEQDGLVVKDRDTYRFKTSVG